MYYCILNKWRISCIVTVSGHCIPIVLEKKNNASPITLFTLQTVQIIKNHQKVNRERVFRDTHLTNCNSSISSVKTNKWALEMQQWLLYWKLFSRISSDVKYQRLVWIIRQILRRNSINVLTRTIVVALHASNIRIHYYTCLTGYWRYAFIHNLHMKQCTSSQNWVHEKLVV